jgi:hypothetical protein
MHVRHTSCTLETAVGHRKGQQEDSSRGHHKQNAKMQKDQTNKIKE